MSKCTLLSTGSIEGSVSLARRDLALRIAVGALLAGTSKFGTQYAFAASAGATLTAEVYARLKAASLVVMLEGQMKGSGALVDAGGLVITSAHGIGRKGSRVEVLTAAAERLRAEVVAVDLGHDLALLKLPAREADYPFLSLADQLPGFGTAIFCLAQPESLGAPILFRGLVTNENPTFVQVLADYVPALALEGTLPPGTSGGPWVDIQGRLVALQFGFLHMHNIPIGVAFASPLGAIRQLLASRQHAKTPFTGMVISELWRQQPNSLRMFPPQTEGLFIVSVADNQPAARAGLKPGDLIVEVESRPVRFRDEFLSKIRSKKPGDQLSVGLIEPGVPNKREAMITLGLLETSWQ
jgi:S1-C subfamily serine protease